ALLEQVQQLKQVIAEPRWFDTHQPLNAVRDHALSAEFEPIADDVPSQLSGLADGMTPSAARSHAPPTHFRLEAIGHHATTFTQSVPRAPQTVSADAIKHRIDAVRGKATDLLHEVGVLVVDGGAAQFTDHCGPFRRARSIHLDAG